MLSILTKMSEGNPGALNVMMTLYERGAAIDPQCSFGQFGGIIALDVHGIYGSSIGVFYKDACGQDPVKMLACLRAVQLGLKDERWLQRVVAGSKDGIDEALEMVMKELPEFNRSAEVKASK
jgi:hypothetical protein